MSETLRPPLLHELPKAPTMDPAGRQHPPECVLSPHLSPQGDSTQTNKNPCRVTCDCKFCYILWRFYEEKKQVAEHNQRSRNRRSPCCYYRCPVNVVLMFLSLQVSKEKLRKVKHVSQVIHPGGKHQNPHPGRPAPEALPFPLHPRTSTQGTVGCEDSL